MEIVNVNDKKKNEFEYKTPFTGKTPLNKTFFFGLLSVQSLGVVFGDIGTSPLYVLNSVFGSTPPANTDDFIAACSLVIWMLIFLVLIKYVIFIMSVNNHGEGGVFALGGLIVSGESSLPKKYRPILNVTMIFGASLVVADGMFTPAISVLSAILGIAVAQPVSNSTNSTDLDANASNVTSNLGPNSLINYVVLITVLILIVLFLVQSLEHQKFQSFLVQLCFYGLFASAQLIWRITQNPRALISLNPIIGISFLIRTGGVGYLMLGQVFLTVTGIEALYADMGHFTSWPIRFSYVFIVLPSLVVQYIGQTALLLDHPEFISNPFYYSIPTVLYWPILVLATLATVIASQSIITATFSLASQAIRLGFAPPMRIIVTSDEVQGQVFVPFVNYFLMIGTLLVTYGFGISPNLLQAFGVTVCTMMVLTTILFVLAIYFYFGRKATLWYNKLFWFGLAVAFFAVFFPVDVIIWGSTLAKIPNGGYVSIIICAIVLVALLLWMFGEHRLKMELKKKSHVHTVEYLANDLQTYIMKKKHGEQSSASPEDYTEKSETLEEINPKIQLDGDLPVTQVDIGGKSVDASLSISAGIFFSKFSKLVPSSFDVFVERTHTLPRKLIFVTLERSSLSQIKPEDRYTIASFEKDIHVIKVRVGFFERSREVELLSIIDEALALTQGITLEKLREQKLLYTAYWCNEIVKMKQATPWYLKLPLYLYVTMKELFPERLLGVFVPYENLVTFSTYKEL